MLLEQHKDILVANRLLVVLRLDLVEVVVLVVPVLLELLLLLVLVVLVLEFPLHFTTQHLPQDLEQDHKLVVV